MQVKEVICSALRLIGRQTLAGTVQSGGNTTAEEKELIETLTYCFNAVEDEAARKYVRLYATENLSAPDGKFYYTTFGRLPLAVTKVSAGGKRADFKVFAQYLYCDAPNIKVDYYYAPSKKTIDDASEFSSAYERMLALGSASEYCYINGEVEAAEILEDKYRKEIDAMQRKLHYSGNIPPRRWV